MLILIIYFDKLLENWDLLFESQCSLSLKHINEIYVYIINVFFRKVQVRNNFDLFIIIFRKARLSILNEYKQNNCFFIKAYHVNLIVIN